MSHALDARTIAAFGQEFGSTPAALSRAPGRVNVIGEHTDYNGGFVLPMAIERAARLAFRPREDRIIRVHAIEFGETVAFDVARLTPGRPTGHWSEYVKGTAWSLREAGFDLRGWDGVLGSDVPIGAGLSSSAAIELTVAHACQAASGFPWEPKAMALRAQHAENEWVGMQCGIMDQLISAAAEPGALLLVDCRSLETQAVPLPDDLRVVVLDTATRRGLVGSAYNERRAQCERAAATLGVPQLRDATSAWLASRARDLDPVTCRRARHVVGENERTLAAAEAARRGDAAALGRLLDASHESLRDDFEVSSPALDTMVACARAIDGCLGARMTGAGFGGCALALVRHDALEGFVASVAPRYAAATGLRPSVYACRPAGGASVRPLQ
jgi:galactokinase